MWAREIKLSSFLKGFHKGMSMKKFITIIALCVIAVLCLSYSSIPVSAKEVKEETGWDIYFRPALRFGSDGRTLYIADVLVPLYKDDKNILFVNSKFTPDDHDGWEVNLGLGYRRLLFQDNLILGVNGFYDKRKTYWGTKHDQLGVGAEIMNF